MAAEALERQQSQGVIGQWEAVESTPSTSSVLPQKRAHQQEDEDEEGEGFKVRRRKLAEGLGQIYDPGKIVVVPKKEKGTKAATPEKSEESAVNPKEKLPSERPVWSTKKWKVGTAEGNEDDDTRGIPILEEDPVEAQPQTALPQDVQVLAPPEEKVPESIPDPSPDLPVEPAADAAPAKSMFKKRKAPGQPVGQKSGLRKQL
jgi:WW domain-binding protein 4